MIAVIQRSRDASVTVADETIGKIEFGLVILLGVCQQDEEQDADYLAEKIAHLRIFEDDKRKMNRSVLDVQGSALVISQFTLCADCRKGRRPSFNKAAPPEKGKRLYKYFKEALSELNVASASGDFGAMMQVRLTNDGPVTIVLDTEQMRGK